MQPESPAEPRGLSPFSALSTASLSSAHPQRPGGLGRHSAWGEVHGESAAAVSFPACPISRVITSLEGRNFRDTVGFTK